MDVPLNAYGTKIHTFQSYFNQVGMRYDILYQSKKKHSSLFLCGFPPTYVMKKAFQHKPTKLHCLDTNENNNIFSVHVLQKKVF